MNQQPSLLRRIDATDVPMILARLVVGVVFVYLAIHKIVEPVQFLKNIREYHLLPETPPIFLNGSAIVLPWVEIICGLLLIVGFWLRGAGAIILVLMVFFTTAIFVRALGVYHDTGIAFCAIKFDCGCGAGVINICKKLAENVSLTVLSTVVLVSRSRRFAIDSLPVRAVSE